MNIENLKSVLLINLVVISVFLTFNLWTYVPDSSKLQNAKYLQDNTEGEQKSLANVILPSMVLFHKENTHLGSENINSIDPLYKLLERGELSDFKDISNDIPKQQFFSFVRGKNKIEMIFPTDMPLDSMRGVFTIKEKISESYSFNRIMIDLQKSRDGNIPVYFISYEHRKVYYMVLKGIPLRDLETARDQFAASARDYSQYTLSDTREIFLPDTKTDMQSMGYIVNNISEDIFINALFTDPRYVKKVSDERENTYTDGIRLMQVLKKKQMLQYTNSAVSDQKHALSGNTLAQRSFDFINSHSGLTDSYRFDYMNTKKGQTTYRLYVDSLPVFNESGMATLEEVWGAEELISYKRPLFKLSLKYGDDQKISLADGKTVIQSLEKNVDMKLIQDIRLGYKLTPESGTDGKNIAAVNLKPIWYVVYGEDNKVLEWSEEKGGELIGLE
ncbi:MULTISPECIES: YycH family regulatory protein [unclassified Bacillus (in: firmicutes)]|uniref:YycH family regulatory protein n=1 Tax=unclassified Bacillus (in: firmicutes) TaxID=185979 RepID=UPI0008F33738|nr:MULTISPECIES: two-component system activity regulator YycH [unclassified Bacillus (in: firmicutes)]SFJ22293.1 Two-component signal transduction system YycFG, regulatory protein YycH [Bacillus sp. 71mf]SFT12385.1 Two-component signal transduction system YycFG, regulatory protein YycH [Bacillus sp. 103mf]